jgi:ATP-binding cassette subfamily B protein
VQALLPLAALLLMKRLVDAVAAGMGAGGADPAAWRRVGWLVAAAAAVAVANVLANALAGLIHEAQAQAVTDRVLDMLHAKSLEADLEYYETPRYYDTLHMAQGEAPYRPISIVNSLVGFLRSGLSLLAVAGLLIAFHWGVTLALLAAVVPGVIVRFRFAGQRYRWQRGRTPTQRLAQYFNFLLTSDASAKELRLYGLGPLLRRRFNALRRTLRLERLALARRRTGAEALAESAAVLAVFGAFLLLARRTLGGAITLGALVMYYQAFQRGQGFVRDMLTHLAMIYENNLFIASFYEFLALEPRVREPAAPQPVPRPLREGIAFEHVTFRYPGGTRPVLEDVSLHVRPGEHVALVGANGAGKTTLVKLLVRLYDPTAGTIRVDGIPLPAFALDAWRGSLGVVFQDYARYHLSARDNIAFGNPSAADDPARVEAAARRSGADAVLRRLPKGYDTLLGRWFDEGEELSIGEWQKVALARAFLRDAPILVLDEPTSALDARAEFEVFEQFHELARDRTALIVSHRLSTVRMVDRIVVLEDGAIAETGTHDDLMRRGGVYAALFELQAQRYREAAPPPSGRAGAPPQETPA